MHNTMNSTAPISDSEGVLGFWFAQGREAQWFASDAAFDEEIRTQLRQVHGLAVAGRLDSWGETARGALALVLLLDQVPRNLFRRTARAFASDAQARRVSAAAIERGQDKDLSIQERVFLYLPFEHSERLQDQERSLALFASLSDSQGGDNQELMLYAKKHHEIIARFGRFPHRNQVLGRETTAEEEEFLRDPSVRFGQ